MVKLRKRSDSSQHTQDTKPSSSSSKGKKASSKDNKTPNSKKKLRSASESNIAETSTSCQKSVPLKKSKSDSGVETKKRGKKRKAKTAPIFSPKKLRSSSNISTSQGAKPQAKTGNRSSRERNPPEVDEPAGDSSNKLGSCASRRENILCFFRLTFPYCGTKLWGQIGKFMIGSLKYTYTHLNSLKE